MSKKRWTAIAVLALALAATGAGAALASGGGDPKGSVAESPVAVADDDAAETESATESAEDSAEGPDVPITGPDLERASAAALEHLGEGRVTATEVGDEESYYEIEVELDNGRQVDVQLDESFNFVGLD